MSSGAFDLSLLDFLMSAGKSLLQRKEQKSVASSV
jgi:hypothetical protein